MCRNEKPTSPEISEPINQEEETEKKDE